MSMKLKVILLATSMVAIFPGTQVMAADMSVYKAAPAPVVDVWNPWMIRVRAVGVIPRENGTVNIPDSTLNATLAVLGLQTANPVPGNVLSVSKTIIPEIDISYFFTPNIAMELILGVSPHNIKGQGYLNGLDIGETWVLPPTLTLQYHFTNFGAFKPYIGGGVNYTVFFNSSGSNTPSVPALTAPAGIPLAVTGLSVKNSFAPAAQIGFDYMLNKHVGLNFDVKKIWLRPDWTGTIAVNAPGNPFPVPLAASGKVNLDPWLIGGGITYKF